MSSPDTNHYALLGRIGAYVTHSRHDPRQTTAKARASFLARFEREVDPDRALPEAERQHRAESARRAHFARLALKSAEARSGRFRRSTAADPENAAPPPVLGSPQHSSTA